MNIAALIHDAIEKVHAEVDRLETPAAATVELEFLRAIGPLLVKKYPRSAPFVAQVEAHLEAIITPAAPALAMLADPELTVTAQSGTTTDR